MAVPTTQDIQVMPLVVKASQQLLQENMTLNTMLRASVDKSMLLMNHLQAMISESEGNPVTGQAISLREKARILSPLSIPTPTLPLERKDFPYIPFWTAKEWNTYKATRQRRNETTRKLAFITSSSGEPATDEHLEQMSETARTLFNELRVHGLAPPTWKAKSQTASDFFINSMVLKFPELRWCEGGSWKAEALAVARYPDCSRKFFNSDDLDDHTFAARSRKRRKTDKSSRQSKQKWPVSPDLSPANSNISNGDSKELFTSGCTSASHLSPLPLPVSEFSFSYTGPHGIPPTDMVRMTQRSQLKGSQFSALQSTALTPEAQALFEHVLDQKLKERDEYYLRQLQAREEEVEERLVLREQEFQAREEEVEERRVLREQEFQADLAAPRVTLESVSRQLEESRVNRLNATSPVAGAAVPRTKTISPSSSFKKPD